ncbi:serine threonine- kinase pim-2-like protein [Labeo rohita]|uniref:non-specific serine/threonine protein kinase n=1 Tax=Labeo rohita TaxID=84645 RepID=A0A498LXZ8_LABRO|nr:serine threonine- kinase pim-2-like protein [Labeo rohita]
MDDEKAEDELAKKRVAFLPKHQHKVEEVRIRKQQLEAERKAEEDHVRKEEKKARRELIKQEYMCRKQQELLEEQRLVSVLLPLDHLCHWHLLLLKVTVWRQEGPVHTGREVDDTVINSRRYEISGHLGEGGFGTVYAATRLDDGLQVAVKFASIWDTRLINSDGYSDPLPVEVALQILASKGPRVQEIIQLLDWQVGPDYYFMVLERPIPCQSLYDYLRCYKGTIEEDVVRVIMHQVIFAAQTCCLRGVLHRDIKLENLLINPDTLEVKLIDFGCGAILTNEGYTSYAGTREYCPPEYHMHGKYHGEPATVWSLGILLYVMFFGNFQINEIFARSMIKTGPQLVCQKINPKRRLELEKLSLHDWFMITDKKNDHSSIMEINSSSYVIGIQLGEGGFGSVYAATRLNDGQMVAIKFVPNRNTTFISIDGYSEPLPLEVALQILANKGPRVEEIIQLLDWQVEPDRYILVLERPVPYEELNWFLLQQMTTLEEDVARVIMRQTVFAAQTCCRRGVLHRDIKLENLLINPGTLKVKLIDFGCGAILTDEGYTSYAGTREYCPPEYVTTGKYHGEPATVWSLGILLFAMVCADFPKRRDLRKIKDNTWTKDGLSKECCHFMHCCLQNDPNQRIELEKLNLHDWFMSADKK